MLPRPSPAADLIQMSIRVVALAKGVGPSTTIAWPGWKQPDIPVEVDTTRLETSPTDTVKELAGYSVQNCPSGNFLSRGGAVGRGGIVYDIL